MRDRPLIFAGLLALCGALGGCMSGPLPNDPVNVGPFFVPKNYAGEKALPADVRRVVVLPVCGDTLADAESLAALDNVLQTALQKQNRFEIVVISRDDCRRRFGATELRSTGVLPQDFMETLTRVYAADAVLFTDLTTYQAYRPLAIGLRTKLATVRDSRIIWNFDEVFSAADPTVINGARHFYLKADSNAVPIDMSQSALQSPSRFAAYAATVMFTTLPPR